MNEDRYGRRARWPSRIPAAGWWDIAKRVFFQVQEDQLPLIAAGVAFYAMLAMFPGIIALVSVYALVADPDQVRAQLAPVVSTLPGGAGLDRVPIRSATARPTPDQGGCPEFRGTSVAAR